MPDYQSNQESSKGGKPDNEGENNALFPASHRGRFLRAGAEGASGLLLYMFGDDCPPWGGLWIYIGVGCHVLGIWLGLLILVGFAIPAWPKHKINIWWIYGLVCLLVALIYFEHSWPKLSAETLLWLQFSGLLSVAVSGWILVGFANRKLRQAEICLTEERAKADAERNRIPADQRSSNTPFRVSDDFKFESISGYYIDRKTKLRVCASCLFPPKNIVSPLNRTVVGFEESADIVWRCGQCGSQYPVGEDEPPFCDA